LLVIIFFWGGGCQNSSFPLTLYVDLELIHWACCGAAPPFFILWKYFWCSLQTDVNPDPKVRV